ncbi:hypothetical protein, partial [Nonomuraea sp. NPDC059022]
MATGVTAQERLRAVQDLCDRGEPFEAIMEAARAAGPDHAAEILSGPLGARMDQAIKRGAARRRELVTLLRPYLATVDPKVKRELPVARR